MKKRIFQIFALLTVAITAAVGYGLTLYFDSGAVAFQSLESRSDNWGPVFNRITFYPGGAKDVWVMQQSHDIPKPGHETWDRIAIVVDKSVEPKTAQYFQLEPGNTTFEPEKKKSLKVSCFMCHSNGPRAIRPEFNSRIKVSLKDRLKLAVWNLRIKTYGRVLADESVNAGSKVAFRVKADFDNQPLKSSTCVKCHNESGFFARGTLRRQHFMSIKFLVERGMMPPPGFHLSEKEKAEVLAFARGL